MADKIIAAQLKLDSGAAEKSIKSYKAELREATELQLQMSKNFGATSDEALAAAKKVGQLKNEIGDAAKLANAFNTDGSATMQAFGGAVRGLAGGFSALTGIMALLGTQNKEVEQAILKVQAAMAISEGINSIVDASKQFKNLGAVIQQTAAFQKVLAISTSLTSKAFAFMGIAVEGTSIAFKVLRGAIIATGIGALVVAIGFLIDKISTWQSETDKQIEKQQLLNEKLKESSDIIYNNQLQAYDRQQKLEEARAKLAGASEETLFNIQQKYDKLRLGAKKAHYVEQGRLDGDTIKKNKDDITNFQNDITVKELNFQAKQRQDQKAAGDKKLQISADTAAKELEIEKAIAKELEELHYKMRAEDIGFVTAADLQADIDEKAAIDKKAKDEEADRVTDLLTKKSAMFTGFFNEQKKQAEDQIALDIAVYEGKKQTLNAISGLLGAFANLVGQQTLAGKVLAIATATINTFVGATEVLRAKTTIPEPFGTIAKFVNVAAVIATGLAAVRNIVKVQTPGGGGGGGSVPSFSMTAPAPLSPAPQQTNTVLPQDQLNQIGNAASNRAFIIESDVTNAQERISRLNRSARLGG